MAVGKEGNAEGRFGGRESLNTTTVFSIKSWVGIAPARRQQKTDICIHELLGGTTIASDTTW